MEKAYEKEDCNNTRIMYGADLLFGGSNSKKYE